MNDLGRPGCTPFSSRSWSSPFPPTVSPCLRAAVCFPPAFVGQTCWPTSRASGRGWAGQGSRRAWKGVRRQVTAAAVVSTAGRRSQPDPEAPSLSDCGSGLVPVQVPA
eukprot:447071-Rhodomonas_salina.5